MNDAKIRYVVEYKRPGDSEWRFICSDSNGMEAQSRFEDAKKLADAGEARIRAEVLRSETIDAWARGMR